MRTGASAPFVYLSQNGFLLFTGYDFYNIQAAVLKESIRMDFLYKLIKSASGTWYLYDAITSRIFQVSDLFSKHHLALFRALKNKRDFQKLNGDDALTDVLDEYIELDDLYKQGRIFENNITDVEYSFTTEELTESISTKLQHLTLCITEKCNLRCAYCTYSGHYLHSRKHSNKVMSYKTAIDAINFFLERSVDSSKINVNFYGGEPLLEIEKIKTLIAHCQNIFTGKEQLYRISSNGTLMTDEFFDWFADNPDVFLNITLNGPEALHDRHRQTPCGSGSYHTIISSLSRLIEKHPKAYHDRVNFLCNYLAFDDIERIMEFFETETCLKGKMPVAFTGIRDVGHDGYISELVSSHKSSEENAYKKLIDMYTSNEGADNHILKLLFDMTLYRMHKRKIYPSGGEGTFAGVCPPFLSRLYVNCDGVINLCERVNDLLEFGNVIDGFDFIKLNRFLTDYKDANKSKCKDCWAIRLCSLCYKDAFYPATIDISYRDTQCEKEKIYLQSSLYLYCSMLEKSSSSMDFLESFIFDS